MLWLLVTAKSIHNDDGVKVTEVHSVTGWHNVSGAAGNDVGSLLTGKGRFLAAMAF